LLPGCCAGKKYFPQRSDFEFTQYYPQPRIHSLCIGFGHFQEIAAAAEQVRCGSERSASAVEPDMAIAALSTAGFSQYLALTSNVGASQQAWQSLQQGLAAGNLTAAQTAFNTYQQLNQNATGSSASSQFATDMTALGQAIGSGDLTQAQQAFATAQSDLKGAPSPAVQSAESAVAQTVDEVDELLGLDSSASTDTTVDPATSILDSAYGLSGSQTTTDPTVALLESKYGARAAGDSSSGSATSTGNSGSAASVNAYA
jgi:hypothetical protein